MSQMSCTPVAVGELSAHQQDDQFVFSLGDITVSFLIWVLNGGTKKKIKVVCMPLETQEYIFIVLSLFVFGQKRKEPAIKP